MFSKHWSPPMFLKNHLPWTIQLFSILLLPFSSHVSPTLFTWHFEPLLSICSLLYWWLVFRTCEFFVVVVTDVIILWAVVFMLPKITPITYSWSHFHLLCFFESSQKLSHFIPLWLICAFIALVLNRKT